MFRPGVQPGSPCHCTFTGKKVVFEVKPLPGLCLAAWEEELEDDCDRHFIINGIKHGFDIIDDDAIITRKNHPSVKPNSPLYEKATSQVIREVENGHYVVCGSQLKIVNPMAAIPKPDGDVRLIHDCSRPVGEAVNDYCSTDWQQKFSCVDDAAGLMTEGCYFAKVDLRSTRVWVSVRLVRKLWVYPGILAGLLSISGIPVCLLGLVEVLGCFIVSLRL